jgi:hypothetical protein
MRDQYIILIHYQRVFYTFILKLCNNCFLFYYTTVFTTGSADKICERFEKTLYFNEFRNRFKQK